MREHASLGAGNGRLLRFRYNSAAYYLIVAVTAIAAVTLCSKSSPMYPFNDWVDVNCFLTVGKGMLNGVVPYRDLCEQKGPLLYTAYALASLVPGGSFTGAWLLECLSVSAFAIVTYRGLRLLGSDASGIITVLSVALITSSLIFEQGGSAEELCLPLCAYPLLCMLRLVFLKRLPTNAEWLIASVCTSLIFWTKYTIGGAIVYPLLYCGVTAFKSDYRKASLSLLTFAAGFSFVTLIAFAYFLANGAMPDLFENYFYNNIMLYMRDNASLNGVTSNKLIAALYNLFSGFVSFGAYGGFTSLTLILGLIFCGRSIGRVLWPCFIISFVITFIGGLHWFYYGLPLMILLPYAIYGVISRRSYLVCAVRDSLPVLLIVSLLSVFAVSFRTPNEYMRGVPKESLVQFEFAKIIGSDPNTKLLNYGFLDGGFHEASGVFPYQKYFCMLAARVPGVKTEPISDIRNSVPDYVVTMMPMFFTPYKLIAANQSPGGLHGTRTDSFYLYRRASDVDLVSAVQERAYKSLQARS